MKEPRAWTGRSAAARPQLPARAIVVLCVVSFALAGCDLLSTAPEPTVTPQPTAAVPTQPVPTQTPIAAPTATPSVPAPPEVTVTPQPTPTQPIDEVPVVPPPTQTATPEAPTPTPTVAVRGRVGVAAVARSIDSQQRPRERATVFEDGERVYVSVEFIGIGSGSTIGIAWQRNDRPVFEYEQPIQSAFTRGYFAFYLDPGDATPGAYSAQILIDGQVQREVSFTIRP